MRTFTGTPSKVVQDTQLDRWAPTWGEQFSASMGAAFEETLPRIAYNLGELYIGRWAGEEISEDEWRASPAFREGLEYHPNMTREAAEILAARHDERKQREFVMGRGQSITAALAGGLVGSLPDPVNFLPIFGPALRAGAVGKFGRVGGRALVSAGEAAAGVAAIQPLVALQAHEFQAPWDVSMAFNNVAIAAGIGASFGALGGALSRFSPEARTRATAKAVDDLMNGRPVDVSRELPPRENLGPEFREIITVELERGYHPDDVFYPPVLSERRWITDGIPDDARDITGEAREVEPRRLPLKWLEGPENMSREDKAVAALEILKKPNVARTAEESAFLDAVDVAPEIERAAEILHKAPEVRTPEERVFLKDVAEGKIAEEGAPMDYTVADHPEPELAKVEPTTPENAYRFDDLDEEALASIETEYKRMDEAGELTPAERATMEVAADEIKKAGDFEKAWQDAAICVIRNR